MDDVAGLAEFSEDQAPLGGITISYDVNSAESRWVPDIDRDLLYYLSGPMKGYPQHNWPAFTETAQVLRNTGLRIVSPHEINPAANQDPTIGTDAYPLKYLRADIMEELKCDGLILMKGWPKSRGARRELDIALDLEFPIYYYHNYRLTSFQ